MLFYVPVSIYMYVVFDAVGELAMDWSERWRVAYLKRVRERRREEGRGRQDDGAGEDDDTSDASENRKEPLDVDVTGTGGGGGGGEKEKNEEQGGVVDVGVMNSENAKGETGYARGDGGSSGGADSYDFFEM